MLGSLVLLHRCCTSTRRHLVSHLCALYFNHTGILAIRLRNTLWVVQLRDVVWVVRGTLQGIVVPDFACFPACFRVHCGSACGGGTTFSGCLPILSPTVQELLVGLHFSQSKR
jgi:hypothetical protein